MKGRNEETSATETDMNVVTLTYQKLKAWHKLRFEETIGKWTEAQSVSAPQINAIAAITVVASMSVSHNKIYLVQGANIAMKLNCAISGDTATGKKKFRSRQWRCQLDFLELKP